MAGEGERAMSKVSKCKQCACVTSEPPEYMEIDGATVFCSWAFWGGESIPECDTYDDCVFFSTGPKKKQVYDAPGTIYLQVNPDWTPESDYPQFDGVTWCVDRVNDTDVLYLRWDK